ncbi:ABC transporter permease [Rhizobium sp. KVB221]|uniref:Spermidine/putrescine transport system permease protein PotC n=1 Tax=Rhizobium setariae TaxID=2801340 RepID=A0A936YVD0_9HYPH|nr:ABC transporter permease [Rhizobium setariae]MBL0373545.1 ABC transporter permease [Rhizobium setariae]
MNPRRFPLTREISLVVLAYLYVPVFVLIVYSFNANRTATIWTHASLDWYGRILVNPSIQAAAWNSLVVAITAATAATILALLAALSTRRAFMGRGAAETVLNVPLILPEIVVAVATLLLFVALGVHLGLGAMIAAHTAFCIPFAYLPIRARLDGMSGTYEEAAQDLYASHFRTFRRVTMPMLLPGVMAGFTLAFVTSLDDFLTSFFLSGPGTTTLPVYIFSAIRSGISPEINAISAVMLVVSVLLVSLSFFLGRLRR